jgi:hypothetical protein
MDDSQPQNKLVGKTISTVDYHYDAALTLGFTDGTQLYVQGVWHNDRTAGTAVQYPANDTGELDNEWPDDQHLRATLTSPSTG